MTRHRLAVLAPFAALAFAVAGCGGGSTGPASADANSGGHVDARHRSGPGPKFGHDTRRRNDGDHNTPGEHERCGNGRGLGRSHGSHGHAGVESRSKRRREDRHHRGINAGNGARISHADLCGEPFVRYVSRVQHNASGRHGNGRPSSFSLLYLRPERPRGSSPPPVPVRSLPREPSPRSRSAQPA